MSWQIKHRQTTYWDVVSPASHQRIHFIGKMEFQYVEADAASLEIVEDHPLLREYQSPWESVYISSAPVEPDVFHRYMMNVIEVDLQPWRSSTRYFNQVIDLPSLLAGGFGLLFSGPAALAEKVSQLLAEAKIESTRLPGQKARPPMKALILGRNYVIATNFRVEEV